MAMFDIGQLLLLFLFGTWANANLAKEHPTSTVQRPSCWVSDLPVPASPVVAPPLGCSRHFDRRAIVQ